LSKTRLNYLQQSLKKGMDLMEKYNAIIEEQRESGIIEPVLNENK
jgi:ABC-type amino acid transport substrate-binding protein